MKRELVFTSAASEVLHEIEKDPHRAGLLKQIRKTLGYLETRPRHPSLQTHKFRSFHGPRGEEVFEAYAQSHTPGAYRIFFFDGPDRIEGKRRVAVLTIFAIAPHP